MYRQVVLDYEYMSVGSLIQSTLSVRSLILSTLSVRRSLNTSILSGGLGL